MSENYTEKPTRIMYKSNLSWGPLQKLLKNMVEFGMLEIVDPAGFGREGDRRARGRTDKRSAYRYRVTKKGFVILRIMDLLFEYVEAPSTVNVPPAIMRIIARTKGYGAMKGDFDKIMDEMINEEMPKLLYEPVPQEEAEEAMEDLSVPQPFVSPRSLDARIIDAGLDWLSEMGAGAESAREAPKETEAKVILTPVLEIPVRTRANPVPKVPKNPPIDDNVVFITEKTFDGMFKCPVCSRPAPSENAVIKHVKKHHGKKALIAVDS
jgi:hypothetical protein